MIKNIEIITHPKICEGKPASADSLSCNEHGLQILKIRICGIHDIYVLHILHKSAQRARSKAF